MIQRAVLTLLDNCRISRHSSRIDAQLLHARDQGRAFEAHAGRGSVGSCYSPVGDFQNADHLITFIGFARPRYRSSAAVVAQFTDWSLKRRAVGEDYRTFDEVRQITNISRPL